MPLLARRTITRPELRNRSGEIVRGLDRGDEFSAMADAPRIDAERFREDVDRLLDHDAGIGLEVRAV